MKPMETRTQWIAILVLSALVFLTAAAFGDEPLNEKIDAIVQADAKYDLFSGTVLVAKDGEVFYSGAFGYANRDHMVANRLDTRFNIGSIGKTFTATLMMQLVQEDKVGLDDPVSKYLPDFPFADRNPVLIKHLLNHSSGLGDYMRHQDYQARKIELRRIEDVLPLIYDQKPSSLPGEKMSYSNSGMIVAGAVIEKVTGMPYRDYLKKRILNPLGMRDTGIVYNDEVVANRAVGYRKRGENYEIESFEEPPAFSDGGIYTTVNDMLKFDQALYGHELLTDKYKQIMFTPAGPNPSFAYGWINVFYGGTRIIYHGGGCPGFNAEFRRYPVKGFTLIVMANYSYAAFELTNAIEACFLGLDYELSNEFTYNFREGMYYQEAHRDSKRACEFFDRNIDDDRPHLPSLYQAARSRISGEFEQEKAIKLLDRYIKLADKKTQPSIAAAWWRKGVALEQLGSKAQAADCYKKSLEIEPGFEQAKEALEKVKG